ncbi:MULTISPECIES: helix-turn-helix transcriptional regulator [Gordonia]|uniref:helix-turn-helix transcriptional regulator n=1 Tax=Gordonia sp. (in: high G+C Gram-positive bacteria) TaxID=84139 RepID=UPI003C79191A
MKMDDLPDVMTPAMLAERLHCSVNALRHRRQNGTGPKYYKLGQRVYYSADSVREWFGNSFQSVIEAKEANR